MLHGHPAGKQDTHPARSNVEFIGELERLFATTLYPYRLLLGLAGAGVVIALGAFAARRRWDRAARRHPRRAVAVLVPLLLIGLPLGWYLGSPLFISRTLDEAPPIIAGPDRPTPGATQSSPGGSGRPASSPSPVDAATRPPLLTLSGEFTGADEFHFGRGRALLIETAPGSYTVRLEEFEVRNGPDLFVYLSPSPDGYADGAIELALLKADRGNQNYVVPEGTSIAGVRSVVIWCRQFAVLFATAPLS
jgi:hypothetical protein